jgi:hypothetical protein
MAKDYNLSKISDLVGKVVRMTDKTGRQVYTRITKVTPFTQEYQDATWQKEGWVKSVTDKNVGQYPYAIEFEVVKKPTQPSTQVNPLVEAGVKPTDMAGNAGKDIQMASESTQFIGFQSGTATVSSTNKYREAWGNKANTGKYSASDVVMVSGSGLFRGVTEAQIKETLTNKYKPLLELAVQAGASFRVGNQYAKGNLSDELIAKYLKAKGYQEEVLLGYSRWTPKMDSNSLADEMFNNEPPVTPDPPSGPTLTPPDNKAPEVDNGLDKGNDKGNMGPLNFTEVSCQLSLGL